MKHRWIALLLAFSLLTGTVACAKRAGTKNANYASSAPAYYEGGYSYTEESAADAYYPAEMPEPTESKAVNTSGSGRNTMPLEADRKLIRDANLSIETKEFDTLIEKLQNQIGAIGGYVESMNESGNSYRSSGRRHAYIYARVPAEELDAFLSTVDGLGNVIQKGMSTRDVTASYVDMESRLKVLETEKDSLQKIMANAATTTEMLETQSRLYDVIEEIEAYEAQKRSYDNLIAYSTVSIDIQEVIELTPQPEETRWEELSRRFMQSLGDLGEAIVDFGIGFVVALPWILVIGAAGTVVFLAVFLPIRAKNRKRHAMKDNQTK